ncbi:MAG: PH domain-containing protein [candidate division WOR-3 bacterium]
MEFKPAKLDRLALITSIITSILLVCFSFFFLINNIPYGWIFALLMLSIVLISYLLSPKSYYIQGAYFIIEKVIGTKISIPISEIEGIFEVDDFYKLKPIRSLGNGGLFGYYGIYTTKDYGNINCQLTRLKDVLIIKSKNGYYAISPEKPERLLEWFRSTTGTTLIKENPEPETIKKKASPLILLVPETIFMLTLIMIILLYPQLPDKIATHFDVRGNPDGWSPKISFIYFGILSQIISLIICAISFFAMRNRYHEPMAIYLLIIMVSVVQLIVAYAALDIYWFNVYDSHLLPMGLMFIFFTGIFLVFLFIYYRVLTKREKTK